MSRVRSKNSKPELIVRSYLHSKGLRFRIHKKELPGSPDIVLPKWNTVVFVHGCFWHGHQDESCKLARMPKSNRAFWKEKILKNQQRDARNVTDLATLGWRVLTIWECQLNAMNLNDLFENIVKCQ